MAEVQDVSTRGARRVGHFAHHLENVRARRMQPTRVEIALEADVCAVIGRDLGETTDLAAEEPEQLAQLLRTWEAWSATMRPGRWRKYTTLEDD